MMETQALDDIRRDIRTINDTLATLTDTIGKIALQEQRLQSVEREISSCKEDRHELWERVHAQTMECAVRESVYLYAKRKMEEHHTTQNEWWNGQIAGWTSRMAWLVIGLAIAEGFRMWRG
jgi:chromosome segregation ATPase